LDPVLAVALAFTILSLWSDQFPSMTELLHMIGRVNIEQQVHPFTFFGLPGRLKLPQFAGVMH
jgi:hypothetical protein